MLDAAVAGRFKGIYIQGEDILQSDPNTRHVADGPGGHGVRGHPRPRSSTRPANYGHVFLPGSTFLEKNGTFTNAERRIQQVKRVIAPRNGLEDWEITQRLSNALGYPMAYEHPSQIMDEIAALTPTFAGVSYDLLEREGSVQWPCNEAAPTGTPVMHLERFVRGLGKFVMTEYVPTDEKVGPRFPLLLTTGRILSQYNVGAQTRRTENVVWHEEDVLEIHPHDAEERGVADGGLGAAGQPGGRDDAPGRGHRPGRAGRGLHHLPPPGDPGQCGDDGVLRLGHQLPGIQGHRRAGGALQRPQRLAGALRGDERPPPPRRRGAGRVSAAPSPGGRPDRLIYMANQIATFFAAPAGRRRRRDRRAPEELLGPADARRDHRLARGRRRRPGPDRGPRRWIGSPRPWPRDAEALAVRAPHPLERRRRRGRNAGAARGNADRTGARRGDHGGDDGHARRPGGLRRRVQPD
jgi:hypothetical protein